MALPQDIRPLNSELADLDHALVQEIPWIETKPGQCLERKVLWVGPRIGPLGGAAEMEEGLRRAAAQGDPQRGLRLHPLGQGLQVRNNVSITRRRLPA